MRYKLSRFDVNTTYRGMKSFDCGNEMINSFVKKSLKKRVKKHLSQAYVLLDESENFVGFYTLDSFSITREYLLEQDGFSGLPPVVPVVKLGMLGVKKTLQGRGLGKRLLKNAFLKVAEISKIAGCAGVFLFAESDAVKFYESLGFVKLKNSLPTPMFLNIDLILEG